MAVEYMFAEGVLIKVGVFVLVQALVYLILSGSSTVFSAKKVGMNRTLNSFRPARSVSIRRMLALLSDMPPEADPSTPSSSTAAAPHEARDDHQDQNKY